MINKLKNCQKTTLIGQLPDIINSNNQAVENEFNWIFDSSLNRLTKSVYAPTGSVKSHFGEFVNLACEYLTVKNVDSLQNSIQRATENVISKTLNTSSMQIVMAALTNIANSSFIDPSAYDISALCDISTLVVNHNVLNNRFYNSDYDTTNYTHDAASIVYTKNGDSYISVYDVLSVLDPSQALTNAPFEVGDRDHSAQLKGTNSKALEEGDVAEGIGTTASGTASHAEGYYTIANSSYAHAEGKFNISHANSIHMVGIGTEAETASRKNAFEITTDGSIYVYDVANWDGKTLNNSSTLQEYIKYLEARIAALESRLQNN